MNSLCIQSCKSYSLLNCDNYPVTRRRNNGCRRCCVKTFLVWQHESIIQNTIKFIFLQQLLATKFAHSVTEFNTENRINYEIRERIEIQSLSYRTYMQYILTLNLLYSMQWIPLHIWYAKIYTATYLICSNLLPHLRFVVWIMLA